MENIKIESVHPHRSLITKGSIYNKKIEHHTSKIAPPLSDSVQGGYSLNSPRCFSQ